MNHPTFYVTKDQLASKEKRFLNYIIDLAVFYVFFLTVGVIFGIVLVLVGGDIDSYLMDMENVNPWLDRLITMLVYVIYYIIIEGLFKGRSIGKFITKTKVVLKDGAKPTINETVVRSLCRIIPFEGFSFLGELGKGWHDTLSKTYVVDSKKHEEKKAMFTDLDLIGTSEED